MNRITIAILYMNKEISDQSNPMSTPNSSKDQILVLTCNNNSYEPHLSSSRSMKCNTQVKSMSASNLIPTAQENTPMEVTSSSKWAAKWWETTRNLTIKWYTTRSHNTHLNLESLTLTKNILRFHSANYMGLIWNSLSQQSILNMIST